MCHQGSAVEPIDSTKTPDSSSASRFSEKLYSTTRHALTSSLTALPYSRSGVASLALRTGIPAGPLLGALLGGWPGFQHELAV